ncbi:hypothetical protein TNCV_1423531 [Trichonephila clavipes]|nr:hypothetical protein TNCV_1423531 [Trichonephila clavipes]
MKYHGLCGVELDFTATPLYYALNSHLRGIGASNTFSAFHRLYSEWIRHDHTRHAMFKSSSLPITDWIASLTFRSITNRKGVVHACATTGSGCITLCYTRSTLAICGSRMDCYTQRIHPKAL